MENNFSIRFESCLFNPFLASCPYSFTCTIPSHSLARCFHFDFSRKTERKKKPIDKFVCWSVWKRRFLVNRDIRRLDRLSQHFQFMVKLNMKCLFVQSRRIDKKKISDEHKMTLTQRQLSAFDMCTRNSPNGCSFYLFRFAAMLEFRWQFLQQPTKSVGARERVTSIHKNSNTHQTLEDYPFSKQIHFTVVARVYRLAYEFIWWPSSC